MFATGLQWDALGRVIAAVARPGRCAQRAPPNRPADCIGAPNPGPTPIFLAGHLREDSKRGGLVSSEIG